MRVGCDPRAALGRLRDDFPVECGVVGVGLPLVRAIGASIPGLRSFPAIGGKGVAIPSTQGALWAFVGGSETCDVHDRACALCKLLDDAFVLREEVATFRYREGRDLSGYEDGTANPQGDAAVRAAIASDGSTFVAAQRWVHDLATFSKRSPRERDLVIGRRHEDNEEIADAPPSAHVKRTEQESFDPPAFMVRRSMPWGDSTNHGLYFCAYGCSLDAFELSLSRMAGVDDGIVDSLFTFTRPTSGGYYWCPPLRGGKLDWSPLT